MNAIIPTRPALRWHGGKWLLAPWIISHFPAHRVYVEPFGGAASVLLRKERCYAEVYNDLDDVVVNMFRVLQDPAKSERLRELLLLTPFARAEFNASERECLNGCGIIRVTRHEGDQHWIEFWRGLDKISVGKTPVCEPVGVPA